MSNAAIHHYLYFKTRRIQEQALLQYVDYTLEIRASNIRACRYYSSIWPQHIVVQNYALH